MLEVMRGGRDHLTVPSEASFDHAVCLRVCTPRTNTKTIQKRKERNSIRETRGAARFDSTAATAHYTVMRNASANCACTYEATQAQFVTGETVCHDEKCFARLPTSERQASDAVYSQNGELFLLRNHSYAAEIFSVPYLCCPIFMSSLGTIVVPLEQERFVEKFIWTEIVIKFRHSARRQQQQ